jgi:hypothetical protein
MATVVYENDNLVIIHMDERDEMDNVFTIANGSMMVHHKDVKRKSPIYNALKVLPVSDEGYEDTLLWFYDADILSDLYDELEVKIEDYWLQYKLDNKEDFYDENGNAW